MILYFVTVITLKMTFEPMNKLRDITMSWNTLQSLKQRLLLKY